MNLKKVLLISAVLVSLSFANAMNVKIDHNVLEYTNAFSQRVYLNLKKVESLTVADYALNKNYKVVKLIFANSNEVYKILVDEKQLNKILNTMKEK